MSERRACQLANQPRGTQRYQPAQRKDEDRLTQTIITLSSQYGCYGYRRITALLKRSGWHVGKDWAESIWRREGHESSAKAETAGPLVA
jgi:putative transposase